MTLCCVFCYVLQPTNIRVRATHMVWLGNVPKHFREAEVWEELAAYGIKPFRMKLREGASADHMVLIMENRQAIDNLTSITSPCKSCLCTSCICFSKKKCVSNCTSVYSSVVWIYVIIQFDVQVVYRCISNCTWVCIPMYTLIYKLYTGVYQTVYGCCGHINVRLCGALFSPSYVHNQLDSPRTSDTPTPPLHDFITQQDNFAWLLFASVQLRDMALSKAGSCWFSTGKHMVLRHFYYASLNYFIKYVGL